MDMAMSAPMESAPDATVEAPSPKRRAAPAAASARSRGFPILTISLLVLLIAGAGGVFLLMNVTVSSDRAAMEPVVSEEVLDPPQTDPTDVAAEDPADSESGPDLDIAPGTRSIITAESPIAESPASIRTEITRLEEAIVFERRALAAMQAAPDGRDEALIQQRQVIDRLQLDLAEMRSIEREQLNQFESETAGTPAIASEPSLLDRFQRMNGPVLWAIAAALFGLIVLLLMMARRKSSRTAKQASDMTPEVPDAPAAPEPPIVPPTPVLDSGHDAFVSYSHSNAETVLPIVQSIEEDGITVWIDRDEMRAGQTWAGQIVRAIKSADQFCLMCSAQAFESDHVRREVYLADKYGKKMVPIRLDATEMPEDIEYFLIGRQWIDLFEVAEEDRLKAIKSLLSESED
ncbi:MAG: toll/interleukin-1 receptor domain-containing protein, partial [Pseudomonadota bacterium]